MHGYWRKLQQGDEIIPIIQTAQLMYLLSPYAFNIAILDFALQSFKIDNQLREYCAVIDLCRRYFSVEIGPKYCLKCIGKIVTRAGRGAVQATSPLSCCQ
jgi:hypothetical protein